MARISEPGRHIADASVARLSEIRELLKSERAYKGATQWPA